jgi:RNA polymerase sigma-70 factor, ECF subfamily
MSGRDLDDLVIAYRSGDADAFRFLVEETELPLRSFVATFAPSLDVIEEVMQQSYVAAFRRLHTYQTRNTFIAWLKGIARICLYKELKQRSRLHQAASHDLERWLLEHSARMLAHPDSTETDYRELQLGRLRECLSGLNARGRSLINHRYGQGLRIEELARCFDTTTAAMAKNLQRLVKRLRDCMSQPGALS